MVGGLPRPIQDGGSLDHAARLRMGLHHFLKVQKGHGNFVVVHQPLRGLGSGAGLDDLGAVESLRLRHSVGGLQPLDVLLRLLGLRCLQSCLRRISLQLLGSTDTI